MIRLSGYEPYRDIDIIETGLRPGEKLYEELLIASRDIEKTENEKIFVEHQPVVTPEELAEKLEILRGGAGKGSLGYPVGTPPRRFLTFREPEELNNAQGERVEIPPPAVCWLCTIKNTVRGWKCYERGAIHRHRSEIPLHFNAAPVPLDPAGGVSLGALLMGIYGGASYSGRQAAASEAREAALEDLQTQRDSLSDEMDSYKQNIKEAERQIRDAQYVIKDRQLTIENYQQQIDGLDVRRADCTAALEKARQVLNTTSNDEARVQAASAVHELNEALTGYTNQELSWQLYILNYQNEIETLKDTSAQDKVIEENEKLLEDKQKELDEMDEEIRKLEIPASASGPVVSAIKFAIVGAVLLACLTCGVVVVLGCFDRRLHDGEELASSCGARLLGDLRRPAETRCPLERRLQRWELGASVPETSEQYDQISANIRLLTEPGEIVVTGTEGKE